MYAIWALLYVLLGAVIVFGTYYFISRYAGD